MINEYKTRSRVFIGVLGALSSLLMAFEFPLPFAPAYMKFEISDVAAIMAGFFLRPGAAALTALIKILIKVFLTGSSTAFVGEWMALFCSLAYVLPASYFYHQFRTTQSAIPALLLGTGFASLFAVLFQSTMDPAIITRSVVNIRILRFILPHSPSWPRCG